MLLRMHGQTPHYAQVVGLYWKHLTCIFIQSSFITTFCWKFRVTSESPRMWDSEHVPDSPAIPNGSRPSETNSDISGWVSCWVWPDIPLFSGGTGKDLRNKNWQRKHSKGDPPRFPVLPFSAWKIHGRFVDLLLFASMLSLKKMGQDIIVVSNDRSTLTLDINLYSSGLPTVRSLSLEAWKVVQVLEPDKEKTTWETTKSWYPPVNWHIPPGEKEHHLRKCICEGYISWQEGSFHNFNLFILPTKTCKMAVGPGCRIGPGVGSQI